MNRSKRKKLLIYGMVILIIMIISAMLIFLVKENMIGERNSSQNEITQENYPWENGEKKNREYTYEEYNALNEEQQLAFQESFETFEEFDVWLRDSLNDDVELPWATGGKSPEKYTYKEYEALSEEQQLAFQESFKTFEEFDQWLRDVIK